MTAVRKNSWLLIWATLRQAFLVSFLIFDDLRMFLLFFFISSPQCTNSFASTKCSSSFFFFQNIHITFVSSTNLSVHTVSQWNQMDMRKLQAGHTDLHSNKEDCKRLKTREGRKQFTLGFRLRLFLRLANERDARYYEPIAKRSTKNRKWEFALH